MRERSSPVKSHSGAVGRWAGSRSGQGFGRFLSSPVRDRPAGIRSAPLNWEGGDPYDLDQHGSGNGIGGELHERSLPSELVCWVCLELVQPAAKPTPKYVPDRRRTSPLICPPPGALSLAKSTTHSPGEALSHNAGSRNQTGVLDPGRASRGCAPAAEGTLVPALVGLVRVLLEHRRSARLAPSIQHEPQGRSCT